MVVAGARTGGSVTSDERTFGERTRGRRHTMSAKTEQWKGRIKQAAGSLTGNKRLEREGRADRRAGEAKERVAQAKNRVAEVIDEVADSIENAIDEARDPR